jgi:hypothetical protein
MKSEHRSKIAGRIFLLHEVIARGLALGDIAENHAGNANTPADSRD